MILVSGFNVYPAELERVLCMHPSVALAAVCGVPDEAKGELAKAYVMLKPGAAATGKGVVEPGEQAVSLRHCAYAGQDTTVTFSPAVGTFTSGVVRGMASTFVDVKSASSDPLGLYNNGLTTPASTSTGPNADAAGTAGFGVRGDYRIAANASNGHPATNGFVHIQAGQFIIDPTQINPSDPVTNLDRLGWAPTSYSPRTVTFSVSPNIEAGNQVVSLDLDPNGANVVVAYIPLGSIAFGSVDIPIAPAPGGLLVAALLARGVRRARRN